MRLAHSSAVPMADSIRLHKVEPNDLPALFAMQTDPESVRMAVVTPRSAEDFAAHWAKVLVDPTVIPRTILLGDQLVGSISCFPREGRMFAGYWIHRAYWGQGIATRALRLLLAEVDIRPLYARVATSNPASLRVLQKCGFIIEQVQFAAATERFPACEEALLVLHPRVAQEHE